MILFLILAVIIVVVVVEVLRQAYFNANTIHSKVTKTGASVYTERGANTVTNENLEDGFDPSNITYGPHVSYPCNVDADCGDASICEGVCKSIEGGSCVLASDCKDGLVCSGLTCELPSDDQCPCQSDSRVCNIVTNRCKGLNRNTGLGCYSGRSTRYNCINGLLNDTCTPLDQDVDNDPHCHPGFACIKNDAGRYACMPGQVTNDPDKQIPDNQIEVRVNSKESASVAPTISRISERSTCLSNFDCAGDDICYPVILGHGYGVCRTARKQAGEYCDLPSEGKDASNICRSSVTCLKRRNASNQCSLNISTDNVIIGNRPDWFEEGSKCPSGYILSGRQCLLPSHAPTSHRSHCHSNSIGGNSSYAEIVNYTDLSISQHATSIRGDVKDFIAVDNINGMGEVVALCNGKYLWFYAVKNFKRVGVAVRYKGKRVDILRIACTKPGTNANPTTSAFESISINTGFTMLVNNNGKYELYTIGNDVSLEEDRSIIEIDLDQDAYFCKNKYSVSSSDHFALFPDGRFVVAYLKDKLLTMRYGNVKIKDGQISLNYTSGNAPPTVRFSGKRAILAPIVSNSDSSKSPIIAINTVISNSKAFMYPDILTITELPFPRDASKEYRAEYGEVISDPSKISIRSLDTYMRGQYAYIAASVNTPDASSFDQLRVTRVDISDNKLGNINSYLARSLLPTNKASAATSRGVVIGNNGNNKCS